MATYKWFLRGREDVDRACIPEFKKFNSNTGATDPQVSIVQTFSHFSYHATDGQWLLCYLQGGKDGNTYTLTDMVINSRVKRFGVTDLGVAGIETFFCLNTVATSTLLQPVVVWMSRSSGEYSRVDGQHYCRVQQHGSTAIRSSGPTTIRNVFYTRLHQ